ncbi:DUF6898 family protein [Azospirillum sp. sgz302134]
MVGREAAGKGGGEVLFEYQRVGTYMKIIAIDPVTATEVSVVGPATGSMELLKRTAISKLQYVLKRGADKNGQAR